MKKLTCTLVAAAALGLATMAQASTIFRADLNGLQEVPPNGSTATGFAVLDLNAAQDRLTIDIEIMGIDLGAPGFRAHIHRAAAGVNGPIVFGLVDPNSDMNGDLVVNAMAGTLSSAWDLMEGNGAATLASELGNLLSGGLYINIHTAAFPGGEIRGQILQVPEPGSLALAGLGLLGLRARRQLRRR